MLDTFSTKSSVRTYIQNEKIVYVHPFVRTLQIMINVQNSFF